MLLSSSNRKYPPFPLLSYFPWLCAWDVCYIIFCHLLYIRSGKTGNLFSFIVQFMMSANSRIVLACRSYSFVCTVHQLIIIIVQTYLETLNLYKMPVRYILSSVWVRLGIFSQLSIIQYVGLCAFSLPIIKSEIWTITHCLGLGHETMVCAVCLSIFLWCIKTYTTAYVKIQNHWHYTIDYAKPTALKSISKRWTNMQEASG